MRETIKQRIEEIDPHVSYARIRGEQLARELGSQLALVVLTKEFSNPILLQHAQQAAQLHAKK